eukprot:TRINITY_DN14_c0_g1_i10.p1 TRINITY_DN14_c0_g1~~TRINITY_DN14_c0_g1_i10.p1  ORF type:complete len:439 (-),score=-142.70 TRINITY_DN14_c0_g1_i10:119-1435(-)
MRGHIRKVAERREIRRTRLKSAKLLKYKPIEVTRGRAFSIRKTYPAATALMQRRTNISIVATYLYHYNILIRNLVNKYIYLYGYKLLYGISEQLLIQIMLAIKNTRNKNRKWVTHKDKFRLGRDEPFLKYNVYNIQFLNRLYINDMSSFYKIVKSGRIYKNTCVRFGKVLISIPEYRRFFYLYSKCAYYDNLELNSLNKTMLYFASLFGNFTHRMYRVRAHMCLHKGPRPTLRRTKPNYKRKSHFTRRLLKYKYMSLYSIVYRCSRAIRYRLYTATQYKVLHQSQLVTYMPTIKYPARYLFYSFVDNILQNYPNITTFLTTHRTSVMLRNPLVFTAHIYQYMFVDIPNEGNPYKIIEDLAKNADLHTKNSFKNKRAKLNISYIMPILLGYQNNYLFDISQEYEYDVTCDYLLDNSISTVNYIIECRKMLQYLILLIRQ